MAMTTLRLAMPATARSGRVSHRLLPGRLPDEDRLREGHSHRTRSRSSGGKHGRPADGSDHRPPSPPAWSPNSENRGAPRAPRREGRGPGAPTPQQGLATRRRAQRPARQYELAARRGSEAVEGPQPRAASPEALRQQAWWRQPLRRSAARRSAAGRPEAVRRPPVRRSAARGSALWRETPRARRRQTIRRSAPRRSAAGRPEAVRRPPVRRSSPWTETLRFEARRRSPVRGQAFAGPAAADHLAIGRRATGSRSATGHTVIARVVRSRSVPSLAAIGLGAGNPVGLAVAARLAIDR